MGTTGPGPLHGGRVSHLFVRVHDLPNMLAFYRDTLGFEVFAAEPGAYAFLRSSDHGPALALYPGRDTPVTEAPHWFTVIDVSDVDEVVEELRQRGVSVGPVEEVPHGRAATFRDPEGNVIEVHEPVLR